MQIRIFKPTEEQIEDALTWPIWQKEESEFPYQYGEEETFYVVEGKAQVTTQEGTTEFGKGDAVVMPRGLSCTWKIIEPIKKHYKFG
jgi:uncharacterized protein